MTDLQPPPSYLKYGIFRHVVGRPRLVLSLALAALVYFLSPGDWRAATRTLIAWDLATLFYFVWTLWSLSDVTDADMRRHAEMTDESRYIVLALAILAVCVSMAAIFSELATAKDLAGSAKGARLGLAFITIVSAWGFIHLLFAQQYAHEFFIERESERALAPEARGGLIFPGRQPPVFSDFLYFSYVIGVACQTADVEISSRPMRKLALVHCAASFFFNTAILALTINIAAGLT